VLPDVGAFSVSLPPLPWTVLRIFGPVIVSAPTEPQPGRIGRIVARAAVNDDLRTGNPGQVAVEQRYSVAARIQLDRRNTGNPGQRINRQRTGSRQLQHIAAAATGHRIERVKISTANWNVSATAVPVNTLLVATWPIKIAIAPVPLFKCQNMAKMAESRI
jgi:hypothetical protein